MYFLPIQLKEIKKQIKERKCAIKNNGNFVFSKFSVFLILYIAKFRKWKNAIYIAHD